MSDNIYQANIRTPKEEIPESYPKLPQIDYDEFYPKSNAWHVAEILFKMITILFLLGILIGGYYFLTYSKQGYYKDEISNSQNVSISPYFNATVDLQTQTTNNITLYPSITVYLNQTVIIQNVYLNTT